MSRAREAVLHFNMFLRALSLFIQVRGSDRVVWVRVDRRDPVGEVWVGFDSPPSCVPVRPLDKDSVRSYLVLHPSRGRHRGGPSPIVRPEIRTVGPRTGLSVHTGVHAVVPSRQTPPLLLRSGPLPDVVPDTEGVAHSRVQDPPDKDGTPRTHEVSVVLVRRQSDPPWVNTPRVGRTPPTGTQSRSLQDPRPLPPPVSASRTPQ